MHNVSVSFDSMPLSGPSPVAAHILRQPGVQRVPNPKVEMFIAKNFLEPELCQLLMIKIDAERHRRAVNRPQEALSSRRVIIE